MYHCVMNALAIGLHCKPKPCKAYRELPVSQLPQGKPCFHYREPLFSLQGPCFHCRDFPVNPFTSLIGIAVWNSEISGAFSWKIPNDSHNFVTYDFGFSWCDPTYE